MEMTALVQFLGSFAKLGKANIIFFRLSFHMEQIGSQWTDFYEIWYFFYFSKNMLQNSCYIKICQEQQLLYMKTYAHLWYLA